MKVIRIIPELYGKSASNKMVVIRAGFRIANREDSDQTASSEAV